MIDIDAVRADTPSCEKVLHFNNAGASLMPKPVYERVARHLALEYEVGGYEAARRAHADLEAFYGELAALLNAEPGEIAFAENATRAWDMAFYGLPLEAGDRILTHETEYASNYLAFLQLARRRDLHIDIIPSDPYGQVDVSAIPDLVTARTRLIAVTHVPTQGGLINPAEEIGKIAKSHGLFYMLDACQSAGQLALDVQKLQCDVLSGTSRKFLRGPRGAGFLYVRRSIIDRIDPPFVDLHAATWIDRERYVLAPDAKRFENWESNVAGRVGLMAAVRYARNIGIDKIEERVSALAEDLRAQLRAIPGVSVHDLGRRKCGIVTFTKANVPAPEIFDRLRERNINISVSSAAYARLDLGRRNLENLARASVHYFNSSAEIERFAAAVEAL